MKEYHSKVLLLCLCIVGWSLQAFDPSILKYDEKMISLTVPDKDLLHRNSKVWTFKAENNEEALTELLKDKIYLGYIKAQERHAGALARRVLDCESRSELGGLYFLNSMNIEPRFLFKVGNYLQFKFEGSYVVSKCPKDLKEGQEIELVVLEFYLLCETFFPTDSPDVQSMCAKEKTVEDVASCRMNSSNLPITEVKGGLNEEELTNLEKFLIREYILEPAKKELSHLVDA